MARKRDYAAEYAKRKARDQEQGTTPGRKRSAQRQATGKGRDYELERERRETRARGRGYSSLNEQTAYRRTGGEESKSAIESWRRTTILAKFGISKRQFDTMRRENRDYVTWYGRQHYSDINHYNISIDQDIHDWSEDRVGYVVSFHGAIVNPASNYRSLGRKHVKKADGTETTVRATNRQGKPITNAEQYFYLVKYTGLFTTNEFEQRYGIRVVREARAQAVPKG